jgi:hypothetical protein
MKLTTGCIVHRGYSLRRFSWARFRRLEQVNLGVEKETYTSFSWTILEGNINFLEKQHNKAYFQIQGLTVRFSFKYGTLTVRFEIK